MTDYRGAAKCNLVRTFIVLQVSSAGFDFLIRNYQQVQQEVALDLFEYLELTLCHKKAVIV